MKILIAIDSFKGSLSSIDLTKSIKKGIHNVNPNIDIIETPIADGGEGILESLMMKLGGTVVSVCVRGPLMNLIDTEYGILPNGTAVIEMAKSSGLTLVQEEDRNPRLTTTLGVGDLIKDALDKGCRQFICGIGGSATNDGGIGMAMALGYQFLDKDHNMLDPIGESCGKIRFIDDSYVDKRLKECTFLIACDVDNPLYGERGASAVYGPQKGASEEDVQFLDQGLQSLSQVVKKQLNQHKEQLEGAGAAGGLGYGFSVFLNGVLRPGIDIIFEELHVEEQLKDVDLVITGEGRIDFQSVMGKAPMGVAKLSKKYQIPCIAIAGYISDDAYKLHEYGVTSMFSITPKPMSLEDAMNQSNASKNVERTIEQIFRLLELKKG